MAQNYLQCCTWWKLTWKGCDIHIWLVPVARETKENLTLGEKSVSQSTPRNSIGELSSIYKQFLTYVPGVWVEDQKMGRKTDTVRPYNKNVYCQKRATDYHQEEQKQLIKTDPACSKLGCIKLNNTVSQDSWGIFKIMGENWIFVFHFTWTAPKDNHRLVGDASTL